MLFVPPVDGGVRDGLDAASVRNRPIDRIWLTRSTQAAVTAGMRRVLEHGALESGLRLCE